MSGPRRLIGRALPLLAATAFAALGSASLAGAETRAPAERTDVASLPPLLQGMLSDTLGEDDLAYRVTSDGVRCRMINTRQRLEATVGPHGYSVRAGSGEWHLRLTGWGRGEGRREIVTGVARARLNRVEIGRGALLEWWVNGPLGLENGWTVTKPPRPESRRPLTLVLVQSGDLRAHPDADERTLAVTDGTGRKVLRYAGLTAADAEGRELPARFEVAGKHVRVHVDDMGATYPIRIDPWVQAATLTASDGAANDLLGISVAMSGDASTLVAGASGRRSGSNSTQGAVYVFTRTASGWTSGTETARLTALDGAANDNLGYSVAVSGDGSTVVAGAPGKQSGSNPSQGAVYVFAKPASGWTSATETARLTASDGVANDSLGHSVGVSGDGSTVVAGAYLKLAGGNVTQGVAYVFTKPLAGWTTGTETAALTASDGAANDFLGVSVAVSGDGSTVVAGAHGKDVGSNPNQGAVYVFVKPASGWTTGTEKARLTATDGTAGGVLGLSTSANGDGSIVAAGAPSMEIGSNVFQGEAYVFVRPGSGWTSGTEAASLTASDGAANDLLGSSVAMSADGSTVVVGAPGKQIGGTVGQGAAYVFVKPGSRWSRGTETARLIAADGGTNDKLGGSVAVNGDGSTAVAGASGRQVGSNVRQGAASLFLGSAAAGYAWYLPSSARSPGLNGAFFTTDVTVGNAGATDTLFTLKFLGNNQNGTGGAEQIFSLAAGKTATYPDVLNSVFSQTLNYGAIRVSSSSPSLNILGQTSTPAFGGTFGQSVPAAGPQDLITSGAPRSIVAIREDAIFRTNLMLSNATPIPVDVDVTLVAADGTTLGPRRYSLAPLGMTQVTRVVRDLGAAGDVIGARLVLSTPTSNGSFAAYASAIDNATNDPRTLLPQGPVAAVPAADNAWHLPSSARSPGLNGAFFTTDLTVGNTGATDALFTLKFLGNNQDGTGGAEQTFSLAAGKTATYPDVLNSVFSQTLNYGAIRISSSSPSLSILGQTSTLAFGGTFGQSVPAAGPQDLITSGAPRSIVAIREDAAFRTNLMLSNATPIPVDVDVTLVAADGTTLGPKRYSLAPLGMTQVTRVVRDLGAAGDVIGARLVLSTPTPGGSFAAYASAIDNVTNDPRTLLPK